LTFEIGFVPGGRPLRLALHFQPLLLIAVVFKRRVIVPTVSMSAKSTTTLVFLLLIDAGHTRVFKQLLYSYKETINQINMHATKEQFTNAKRKQIKPYTELSFNQISRTKLYKSVPLNCITVTG
jgi:hypothetical protein